MLNSLVGESRFYKDMPVSFAVRFVKRGFPFSVDVPLSGVHPTMVRKNKLNPMGLRNLLNMSD